MSLPKTREIIVNTSPLVFLGRAGYLGLLRCIGDSVAVPDAVVRELNAGGRGTTFPELQQAAPWLNVATAATIPPCILEWGLGTGESSVLSYAMSHPRVEAVLDDLAARRCADCLGIPVRGTLGIILVAKRKGHIDSARDVMVHLLEIGLYLSRPILDEALKRVGE